MISMKQSYEIEYDGTHNVCRMDIYADTAADLSGLDNLDGVYFLSGSTAYDISTGDLYMMNSSGTWILQPSANQFQNVYTKSEIDDIVSDINADIADAENDISELQNGISFVIDTGGKNRVQPTATSQTVNGIDWTVNADGTISATGTATANSYITIQVLAADSVFDGSYYLSGCPAGGGNSSYALYVARGSYTKYDYGNGVVLSQSTDGLNKNLLAIVYSGQTVNNLIFRPMICKKSLYDISPDFAPYCPTLAELYALVKSYHP